MTSLPTPDDYEDGPAGMIAAMSEADQNKAKSYRGLLPLSQRGSTSVKLSRAQGDDEAQLALRFGYSQPIAQISQLSKKQYGYMRDGHVTDPDEKAAILGSNAINDLILMAPCVTRQERYDEEEKRAQGWINLIGQDIAGRQMTLDPYADVPEGEESLQDDDEPAIQPSGRVDVLPRPDGQPDGQSGVNIHELLDQWGEADAMMLQCRVDEERYGIDYAERYYDGYDQMEEQRRDVEMRASKLTPAENMLFWCRVRQYKIMRERAFDLAMGYPVHDFTEVKSELAGGKDIHDLVHRMSWAFLVGYNRVVGSMMDGEAHRTLMMSMIAGQLPQPAPQLPWGMPPGYWQGQQPQGDGQGL